jgi:spermidine synthase
VPRRIYPAVALISVAVLMLQIALNRIFSYTTWHHLAYISVSLALLGFGASGAILAAFPRLVGRSAWETLSLASALSAACALLMLVVIGVLPLQPMDLATSSLELARFALYFLVVSLPFFFAGFAITLALREAGVRVDVLYSWDLIGAGMGCALVVYAISWLQTPRVVLAAGLLLAVAGVISAGSGHSLARRSSAVTAVVLLVAMAPLPEWLPFPPSKDKFISYFVERGYEYYSRWGELFRTDLLMAPGETLVEGGYRKVGISPRFSGASPPFRLILHDGGAGAIMYQVQDGLEGFELFHHHVLTAPYRILERPEVLIIGVGGGADVMNALTHGAKRVVGAELDPLTVELIAEREREFTGGIYDRADVTLHAGEGRHFVRSTRDRFDLLQMTGVDTLAALSSGAYVLAENYLYTTEAYHEYFRILRPGGLLSVGAVDFHPRDGAARHAPRFCSISYRALRERGIADPYRHIAVIGESRGIAQFEVLTKLEPFTQAQIDALERFVDEEGFEAWYLPEREGRQLSPFRELLEAAPAERKHFLSTGFLDLRAPTDDRPFFFNFYKWRHLFDHRAEIDPGHLLATGQLVLVFILALSAFFSIMAILVPLFGAAGAARPTPGRWGFLGYFAALGAGFIFAEISFVQRFIQFLGYPTYALTVVLFSFLTAAGVGAYLSRWLPGRPGRVLPLLVGALALLVIFYVLAMPPIMQRLIGSSLPIRILVTIALCVPMGGVLGTFFPYGIRLIAAVNPDFTPWAWAVNGCLTVVGSVATIILATALGFDAVMLLFLVIYALGVASFCAGHARLSPEPAPRA